MVFEEWKTVPLASVAEVRTGMSKSSQRKCVDPVQMPYLRVANVQDGHLDLSEVKTIAVERSEATRHLLCDGDVLLTEGGDFDKLGRGTVWKSEIPNCLHQNHIFAVRTHKEVLIPEFLSVLTCSGYGKSYFLKCSKQSTNLASINSSQLRAFPVLLPSIDEQRAIVEVLSAWDRAIDCAMQLYSVMLRRKQGLMQEILTGQRRHEEYSNSVWVQKRLGDLFVERHETGRSDLPLLSITNKEGIVPRDTVERRDTSNEDKSKYLRICKGDIGYNTMRMWQGVSAMASIEGIISPAYTVCKPLEGVDGHFMEHLFKLPRMIHLFFRYSQGLVDDTLSLKFEAFSKIEVTIPSLDEQKYIACVLDACNQELELLECKLTLLKKQKQGLMQQLLTGKVRVKDDAGTLVS
jgi:Restriction endonuclease S subunits